MDDLDDLLAGGQALGQVRPEALLLDAADERPNDPDVDVGLEERQADLSKRFVHVVFTEAPAAPQTGEDGVEAV